MAFVPILTHKRLGVNTLRNKQQQGFTLIELLVVIAIIGLLASVVLLALNSARARSRDAKRLADVRQVSSAIELYVNDNGALPASLGALVPTYMPTLPTAPTPADGTCTSTTNTYTYSNTTPTNGYSIAFCLGASAGGNGAGVRNVVNGNIQ